MPLRQNPSCLKLSRLSLLILFNYLHVYAVTTMHMSLQPTSVFFLTHSILSIYYLFRREKSRHVENRIAWLVTRLQFLNYAAIICLFPATRRGPSSRRNYRVSVL